MFSSYYGLSYNPFDKQQIQEKDQLGFAYLPVF